MADDDHELAPASPRAVATETEPPVVARLVIEIRSDGTRTIARGALEDRTTGIETKIEAEDTTPLALARSLTRALTNGLAGVPASGVRRLAAFIARKR